jgi:hypothetical protein
LESAGNNISGKFLVNNAVVYDPAFVFHIGLNTVMTSWIDAAVVAAESLLVPGVDNVRPLKVNSVNTRDASYQMHIAPTRVWAKNLTVETSLAAPELTTVQSGLAGVVNHANNLQVAVNDVETHVATLQEWRTGLDPRVTALEANRITPRTANTSETQYNVLSGTQILPLVAGPGVLMEVVNRTITGGLQIPDFFRISAGPWVAGRLRSDGVKLTSVGRYDYSVTGKTSDAAGLLISWVNPPHPANLDFVMLVTPLPMAQGRERLFWNTWIGSSRSFRIFVSDFNGVGVDRHLTFAVH